MGEIVIACVGSPYGADRLGHAVADILRRHPALQTFPEGMIRIEACDRPQLNLLAHIEGAQLAIIVDAMQCEKPPGHLMWLNVDQLATGAERLSSHAVGVAEALALGRALNMLPPRLLMVGLSIGESLQWKPKPEDLAKLADNIINKVKVFTAQLENSIT
jgi:hydrogenase maturation protease